MAIEYSGWIEVPRGEAFGGGTVRIPFVFGNEDILTFQERIDRLHQLYNEWRNMLTQDYNKPEGRYGEPIRHKFTSVTDTGWSTPPTGPHFGK